MLQPTRPEIQKLMFLRDVVIPFVKEREKEGKVNLYRVWHECGSPSCLLGWSLTFMDEFGLTEKSREMRQMQFLEAINLSSDQEYLSLFGGPSGGTLDDRAKACDRIIERMLMEVKP